jgi:NADH-quinone oxidoreductase subunit C
MVDELERGLSGLESGPERTADGGVERGTASEVAHPSVTALREKFGGAILHHELHAGDEHVVFIAPERNVEILRWLHDDAGQQYDLLVDLTAVDYGGGRPLQVVYQLWSIPSRRALRVKAELPLDALQIATVVSIWSTANWLEREVYDFFGIEFRDHPDLRRIMMPENYAEGYPLRKDFPLRGRFGRPEQTRRALALELADYYTAEDMAVMERPRARQAQPGGEGDEGSPEGHGESPDSQAEDRVTEESP